MFPELLDRLPYERDFLFIDEIKELKDGFVKTIYTFSDLSPIVKAHFKGKYIAGCLLTEQICQSALVLLVADRQPHANEALLTRVNSNYFLPVRPGVCIETEVTLQHSEKENVSFKGTAFVNGERAAMVTAWVYISGYEGVH